MQIHAKNFINASHPAFISLISLLATLGLLTGPARAQVPVPPLPANPQAPTLAPVGSLGMQRGTRLELTLTGTNLAEPTGLWTSFPAKTPN